SVRETLTYDELCIKASRAGRLLASLGCQRGERVLLLLNDTAAYPAFLYGAMRLGFVPVLTNTLTPPDLVQYYLQDAGARIAVVDAEHAQLLSQNATQNTPLEHV